MKGLFEVTGTYGGAKTPSTIFCYTHNGATWYVAEGSKNVNCTYEDINEGVNIELLEDIDIITSNCPIESLQDLEHLIDFD